MAIALNYAARSDIGLTRSNNQDSAYAGPHLLVIADGMGGHAGGDVASSVAVAHLVSLDEEAHGSDDVSEHIEAAVDEAHDDLLARVAEEPALAGMGTTITALVRSDNKLTLAHIGDSRAYLLRGDEFSQITTDHTFVQYLVESGKLTPEQAERHPQRSLLLRVLGDVDLGTGLDISVREAIPGDRWLLCSDGLSGVVSSDTLAETLKEYHDVGECAEQLIQLALRGGGPDNVTCIVADVVDLDTLGDGKAPSTAAQIVGAAAIDRDRPTRATDTAAARAAELTAREPAEATEEADDDEPEPEKRRSVGRILAWVLISLGVVGLIAAAGLFGYQWTQGRYYVGESHGQVAIYQGVDQTVGPLSLSHVYQTTDIAVSTLPEYMQDRVEQTISVSSLSEADDVVDSLRTQDEGSTTPTPTPSATSIPPTQSVQATPAATSAGA